MSIFLKKRRLNKKDLKEIVNNSEDSDDSDISPQNISRPIYSESKKR